ncbi:lysozyme inhibitor LprI family protein [Phormidium sp. LEGE 05292]|uniref:lysozyme inhibitor LprI family protein n=1 Tax=[Phormidium] sp. LEGE 05292 TaxID=767427 RepID=UPI00187E044D|nr:lysozyme inhibitor LprI family protein [Phormidium sp. LEGE 05292]MBE9227355.1 lysozyme inhibitor LprI family protein [Phormidium sp. LEGE 05292]
MQKFVLAIGSAATIFILFLAIRTFGSAPSQSSALQVAQQPNCKDPQTQLEINICAGIEYRNADKRLNQVYQQLMPKLSAARKQKFILAQRAWINFRDANCEFERSQFEGGTIAPAIQAGCLTQLTKTRTAQLEKYIKSDL